MSEINVSKLKVGPSGGKREDLLICRERSSGSKGGRAAVCLLDTAYCCPQDVRGGPVQNADTARG